MAIKLADLISGKDKLSESRNGLKFPEDADYEKIDSPYRIDGKIVSVDEYYEKLGELVEAHPIVNPHIRRG